MTATEARTGAPGTPTQDLARRGLDFSTPRLYVLDGAKAVHSRGEMARIVATSRSKRGSRMRYLQVDQSGLGIQIPLDFLATHEVLSS